jgi:hypothetical protein
MRTATRFHEVLNEAPITTLLGMLGIITGALTSESEPASLAEAYRCIHVGSTSECPQLTEGVRRTIVKAIIDAEPLLDAKNGVLWTENQFARFVAGLSALPKHT